VIKCPHCGSTSWRCWDERTLDWWDNDTGELAGVQVVGCMACNICNTAWADVNPPDEAFTNASPNDDERDQLYRVGWH
jgi:hypothetical protein